MTNCFLWTYWKAIFQQVRRDRRGEKELHVGELYLSMWTRRWSIYLLAWYRLLAGWLHSGGGQCESRSWVQSSELCTRWLWLPLCEKQGRVKVTGQWDSPPEAASPPYVFVSAQPVASLTSPHSSERPSPRAVSVTPTLLSWHSFGCSKAQSHGGVSHCTFLLCAPSPAQ